MDILLFKAFVPGGTLQRPCGTLSIIFVAPGNILIKRGEGGYPIYCYGEAVRQGKAQTSMSLAAKTEHKPGTNRARTGHEPNTNRARTGHEPGTNRARAGRDPCPVRARSVHEPGANRARNVYELGANRARTGHELSTNRA